MNNNKTSFKRFSFECEPIPENPYWYNLKTEDGVYFGTVRVSDAWRLTVERDELLAACKAETANAQPENVRGNAAFHTAGTSRRWAQRCGELENACETLQGELDHVTAQRDELLAKIDSALAALSGIEFVHDTKTGMARAKQILEATCN